jgi:hypothetical protein
VLVRGDEEVVVPVTRVTPVDATGAGDQFAAGFLYGLATDRPLDVAGRMGCVAAAEVIGHYGARPETELRALFKPKASSSGRARSGRDDFSLRPPPAVAAPPAGIFGRRRRRRVRPAGGRPAGRLLRLRSSACQPVPQGPSAGTG